MRNYSWRASRNLSCSSSVQLSRDLVMVYGFLTFFPDDGDPSPDGLFPWLPLIGEDDTERIGGVCWREGRGWGWKLQGRRLLLNLSFFFWPQLFASHNSKASPLFTLSLSSLPPRFSMAAWVKSPVNVWRERIHCGAHHHLFVFSSYLLGTASFNLYLKSSIDFKRSFSSKFKF